MDGKVRQIEEDASTLQFGPDFEIAECMWHAEVAVVLENELEELGEDESELDSQNQGNLILKQTLDYVRSFKKYRNVNASSEARTQLLGKGGRYEQFNLHNFEVAVINNLGIESADEAYSLVPSLVNKIDKDNLDQLLEDIKRYQSA